MKSASTSRLLLTGLALFVLLCAAVSVSYAGPFSPPYTMNAYVSIGPNSSSPNWNTYVTNALSAIGTGALSLGTPGTPGYYQVLTGPFLPGQVVVSGFNSWNGVASPAAPYNNEFGNRIYFGLYIAGSNPFDLTWLVNDMNSNDATNSFNNDGGFVSFTSYLVGTNYGKDGKKGGGDDTVYTSGAGAGIPINQLVYVGVGNAFDATGLAGTNQQKLDAAIAYINSVAPPFSVTNYYCLGDGAGHSQCVDAAASVIPEPGTFVLFAAGLLGLLAPRWLKKR